MVTVPALLLLLLVAAICIKTSATHTGSLAFGGVIGLVLASTAIGPPLLDAITATCAATLHALGGLA